MRRPECPTIEERLRHAELPSDANTFYDIFCTGAVSIPHSLVNAL